MKLSAGVWFTLAIILQVGVILAAVLPCETLDRSNTLGMILVAAQGFVSLLAVFMGTLKLVQTDSLWKV